MANQITRDIYVLRKSIIEPIHYVRLTNAVDIVFNMRDYEIPSGAVAAVYAQKPDGTAVYSNATISDNSVTVEMTTQMVAVLGVGHLQVRIQSGSNSADVLCSFVVPLIVEPNFTEGDFPPSQNENGFFGDVEEHLQQVESDMTTMKEEWTEFQSDITQQVQEIQEEQTTQGNEITDLQKKVAKLDEEKSPALVLDASGNWVTVEDSGDSAANGLTIHGKSTQVVTTGKNIFDIDDLISSPTIGGEYKEFVISGLEQNTLYTMSAEIPGSIVSEESNKRCLYFSVDGSREIVDCVFAGNPKTITTNEEGSAHIILFLDRDYSQTVLDGKGNIQIEKGENATPFEPYTGGAPSPSPDYPQEITSVGDSGSVEVVTTGAQLWQNVGNTTAYGVTITILEDGWINLDGTCTKSTNFGVVSRSLETGEYTLSIEKIGSFPNDYNSLAQVTSQETGEHITIANNSSVLFASSQLTGANDYVYRIRIEEGFSYNNAKVRVMFQKGNEVTPWEPYRSSTATFSTPNGLPGIPVNSGGNYIDEDGQQWICDEIDTKAGVYRQRVGKITFDGSEDESWNNYSNETYRGFSIFEPNMKRGKRSDGMCDRFAINKNDSSETYGIWLGVNNQYIYFHNCNPSIASSVEEWRTWLSTHPVTLIYPLATPVETPLSDAELIEAGNLRTFATTTNVTTEDPVEPEITLEYAADLKTYIDKKLAEISAATLENATNASQ